MGYAASRDGRTRSQDCSLIASINRAYPDAGGARHALGRSARPIPIAAARSKASARVRADSSQQDERSGGGRGSSSAARKPSIKLSLVGGT